ncbi:ATP-binding protein [Kordia algicida OT-1]|uniref:histidine kinase n=1 Tax=Kordia algicida OT-1 TaxID=391587 RepID=A9DN10_9FLAO|nr:ATP-binding protein [Kordia algicida]EDP97089.1 two-component sensor histidine kinase (sensor protein AtoS) [Kordia algicida OT-1]
MKLARLSLRSRIFAYMILLILVSSILIALVTILQYREQSKDYHDDRLERKEDQVRANVKYLINRETTYEVTTENLQYIFKYEIYKISDVHNITINIYDLEGEFILTSDTSIRSEGIVECLPAKVLNGLQKDYESHFIDDIIVENNVEYQSSYTIIEDAKSKPIGILNLQYERVDSFTNKELREFLARLGLTYLIMLVIAVIFAYFVSKYITKSLKKIGEKLDQTRLNKRNEKIIVDNAGEEIYNLINAYNGMIDELDESAVKLAKSEREQAWREMAKQVAHEIKNPLTPMRLTVQSFQRKFDPEDPDILQKVDEYSKTLIQQIDTMSSIASAFSNFAKMPAQQNEMLNIVEVTRLAMDLFNEDYINYSYEEEEIIVKFDRTQLIRVITNLVKNAIQAISEERTPRIDVRVFEHNESVMITVKDNGIGITKENEPKIFEPKFTTKSSGMGLGLGMVKNIVETYDGSITFTSEENVGTTFTVSFPKT